MSEELMQAITDGTAVAGEDLNPGDELQLGEDGKVYRVHPHGWVRWSCRRPEQGQAIRILGSSEQWIADGDTVQTRAGARFTAPIDAQWKPYVVGGGMHSACLSSVLPSAEAVASILYHGDGGTFTRAEIEADECLRDFMRDMKEATRRAGAASPDPDPNPWRRVGGFYPVPSYGPVELRSLVGRWRLFMEHGVWEAEPLTGDGADTRTITLTDDAEWRYAHP